MSGTFRASRVTTVGAGGAVGRELNLTLVALAMSPLGHVFQDPVGCTGDPGRYRERRSGLVVADVGRDERRWLLLGTLGLLGGETGALLASLVAAVGTRLVRAIGHAAAMARAVHAHPDRLLDPLRVPGGTMPFVGFEREAVFLKHLSRPFLILGVSGPRHGDTFLRGIGRLGLGLASGCDGRRRRRRIPQSWIGTAIFRHVVSHNPRIPAYRVHRDNQRTNET